MKVGFRIPKWLIVTALILAAPIVCYSIFFPTFTYRYRMTMEVMVDGVVHSGSSVIEIRMVKQPPIITTSPPMLPKAIGEAVFVDSGRAVTR